MQNAFRSAFITIFLLFAIPAILLKFTLFDLLTFDLTKGERAALQWSKGNLSQIFMLREAVNVLSEAQSAILYSLEPDADVLKKRHIQKYHELKDNKWGEVALSGEKAQIAGKEFRKAIGGYRSMCGCFEPRHALRVFHHGHVYDYTLCYSCFELEIKKDGEFFMSLGTNIDESNPDALNQILKDGGVPLPYIYTDDYQQWVDEINLREQREKERWVKEMPASLKPLLENKDYLDLFYSTNYRDEDLLAFHKALSIEFPDNSARILELLRWYGSGDNWFYTEHFDVEEDGISVPDYQDLVPQMLRSFDSSAFLRVVHSSELSDQQLRGLVRWYVEASRVDEKQPQQFTYELKTALLQNAERFYTGKEYLLQKARDLFSGNHNNAQ